MSYISTNVSLVGLGLYSQRRRDSASMMAKLRQYKYSTFFIQLFSVIVAFIMVLAIAMFTVHAAPIDFEASAIETEASAAEIEASAAEAAAVHLEARGCYCPSPSCARLKGSKLSRCQASAITTVQRCMLACR
ncbi:hypothetical protein BGZ76_003809 [Entomortierella beljakovae]|nr:hypothetical protein BGZ76_003809 [Entomortierella beljakovae]